MLRFEEFMNPYKREIQLNLDNAEVYYLNRVIHEWVIIAHVLRGNWIPFELERVI